MKFSEPKLIESGEYQGKWYVQIDFGNDRPCDAYYKTKPDIDKIIKKKMKKYDGQYCFGRQA